jgi:hypothetical protein
MQVSLSTTKETVGDFAKCFRGACKNGFFLMVVMQKDSLKKSV